MNLNKDQIIYKYQLIKKLGNGSFGEVWLAKDVTIDKIVALKILPSEYQEIASNLDEAKNGKKVSHKNLLEIYYADIITLPNNNAITLIAQKYEVNGTVENLLNSHNFLDLPKLLKIMKDILLGLEFLHNANVIHNDIKPSNILIDKNGNGILADYGISGFTNGKSSIEAKNMYIAHGAPETIINNEINVLTDIYQVGCTAYRLANGIGEIKKDIRINRDLFIKNKTLGKIPSKKHQVYVPKKLARIINKATELDPNKRYSSAIEMKHELEKLYYPGYWTTDPLNTSELIGIGTKYTYKYNIIQKSNNNFQFYAYKINKDNKTTRITHFCQNNLTSKKVEKLKSDYFEWIFNNAK